MGKIKNLAAYSLDRFRHFIINKWMFYYRTARLQGFSIAFHPTSYEPKLQRTRTFRSEGSSCDYTERKMATGSPWAALSHHHPPPPSVAPFLGDLPGGLNLSAWLTRVGSPPPSQDFPECVWEGITWSLLSLSSVAKLWKLVQKMRGKTKWKTWRIQTCHTTRVEWKRKQQQSCVEEDEDAALPFWLFWELGAHSKMATWAPCCAPT